MAEIKIIGEQKVAIADIDVGDRLRGMSESGVGAVLSSLEATGVIAQAIWLRKVKGGYVLIDGLHRIGAAERFGLTELDAKIFECSAKQARLLEIDGNLAGAELNALDTAIFLARRKTVYEELHPEAKRGLAGAVARWDATDMMSVASFTAASAEKFGMTDRHIRRLVQAGDALSDAQAAKLREAEQPIRLADLQELAKIGEREERDHVIDALARGAAKSASEARKQFAPKAAQPEDPVEAAFKDLLKRWSRAPKEAKRRFAEEKYEELAVLTDEVFYAGDAHD